MFEYSNPYDAGQIRTNQFLADMKQSQHEQTVRTAEMVGTLATVNYLVSRWSQHRQQRKAFLAQQQQVLAQRQAMYRELGEWA